MFEQIPVSPVRAEDAFVLHQFAGLGFICGEHYERRIDWSALMSCNRRDPKIGRLTGFCFTSSTNSLPLIGSADQLGLAVWKLKDRFPCVLDHHFEHVAQDLGQLALATMALCSVAGHCAARH